MSDDVDVEVATLACHAAVGGPRRVVLVPLSPAYSSTEQGQVVAGSQCWSRMTKQSQWGQLVHKMGQHDLNGTGFPATRGGQEVECSSSRESPLHQPEGPSNQDIEFEEGDGADNSDTESLHGHSDFEGVPDIPVPAIEPEREANQVEVGPRIRETFRSLDEVDVAHLFTMRAVVMKNPPTFVRGVYCAAMRIALQEIVEGSDEARIEDRQCRGWKLFLLLILSRAKFGGYDGERMLTQP